MVANLSYKDIKCLSEAQIATQIKANGPAVEGVNVTRRSHPVSILIPRTSGATKLSRWQGGYGAIFASPGRREKTVMSG